MDLRKKGFFFTMDALLASAILLGGLLILSSYYISTQPTYHLNYLSQDILNSLDALKLNEINNSYARQLIANGTINDTNNSILQQAGEFWANGRYDLAEPFIANVADKIVPKRYGFGVWISDDLIFQRDNPPPKAMVSSRKLISGIAKQKPIDGYISKARVNNFVRKGTEIISFSPEGSGWYGISSNPGEATVTKYFELPSSISITNSMFYISLHIDRGNPSWEVININNRTCIINQSSLNRSEEGIFDKKNITGCIVPGKNSIQLKLRNTGYHGHIHPGMFVKVDYSISESVPTYNSTFSKRYYFDDVRSVAGSDSRSGAWQIMPFFIPSYAQNVSVSLRIAGKNIRNYTGSSYFSSWSGLKMMRDYDYIIFLNDDAPFSYDSTPSANPTYTYNNSQLKNYLVNGTNVLAAYFNNYGDYEWGGSISPMIYSDPYNDPANSSYLELNYTIPSTSVPYGNIRINSAKEFGGTASWQKETSFNFPQYTSMIGDVFTHIVQRYSYIVDVDAGTYTPPPNRVFSSPSSRAVPTTVFIPPNVLSMSYLANNYVRVSDRNRNDILPDTSIEYNFYVPSFVGYGGVFSTQSAAESDATYRLNSTLGQFISSSSMIVESSPMTGVPSLWGPAVMEVRAWH